MPMYQIPILSTTLLPVVVRFTLTLCAMYQTVISQATMPVMEVPLAHPLCVTPMWSDVALKATPHSMEVLPTYTQVQLKTVISHKTVQQTPEAPLYFLKKAVWQTVVLHPTQLPGEVPSACFQAVWKTGIS